MSQYLESNENSENVIYKGYSILTLDVFDTCLIRDFVSQESLWHLLGREIVRQLPGVSSAADFARLRAASEDYTRNTSDREDITLNEIYARLASICGWNLRQQERAVSLEKELETRGLSVNPAARSLLAAIQQAAVCYLTDTPHSGAFIEKCLIGQQLPAGPVLSSGDHGMRKGTGSLFRIAMERLNADHSEILHIGNDLRSDGGGSAAAGVAFGPLLEANPNRYEKALDALTSGSAGLLGGCLAGCGRALRLEKSGQFSPALLSVVTGVAGPAIFAAAAWVLLSAQADGVETLYFVSRDGEILLAAAELLRQELGMAPEIQCRYLYGSRRAWHLPALSLMHGSSFLPALRALLVQSGKTTLRDLLAQLDLEAEEARRGLADSVPGISLDAPLGDRRSEVIDALVSSALIQSLAKSRATAAYEATVAYLRQEEMFSHNKVGLVDIGWLGHASASLIAVAADQGAQVQCYFAGGLCGRGSQRAPKESRAFLIDARGEEPKLRSVLVHLLETFCAGSGRSTSGYVRTGSNWVPRFDSSGGDAAVLWGIADYQALIRAYVQAACRALVKVEWKITLAELKTIRPALIANIRTLWRYPTYEEAELWGSFPFEGDFEPHVLGRPFSLRDLLSYAWHFKSTSRRPQFGPWRQAVVVRTIGGRLPTGPFGLLQVMSPAQRQIQLAKVRAKLARRPEVRVEDIAVQGTNVIIRTTPPGSSR